MSTRVKKYKGKKTLSRSTSESVVNALFVKNLFARNHKKTYPRRRKDPLEINELPPADANHDLLNNTDTSFHVKRLDDTFDKLKNEEDPFELLKHQNNGKYITVNSDKSCYGGTISDDKERNNSARQKTEISVKEFTNSIQLNLDHTKVRDKSEIVSKNSVGAELDDILSYSHLFNNSDFDAVRSEKSSKAELVQMDPCVDVVIGKVQKSSSILGKLGLCSTPISINRKLQTLDDLTPIKVHDCASSDILEQSLLQVYNWSFKPPEISAYEPGVPRRKRRLAINGYKSDSDKSDKAQGNSTRHGSKRKCYACRDNPKLFAVKKFAANQTPSQLNDTTRSKHYGTEVIPLSVEITKLPDEQVYNLIERQNERYQDLDNDITCNENKSMFYEYIHNPYQSIIKSCIQINEKSSIACSQDPSVVIFRDISSCKSFNGNTEAPSYHNKENDLKDFCDEENEHSTSLFSASDEDDPCWSPQIHHEDHEANANININKRKKSISDYEDFYESAYKSVVVNIDDDDRVESNVNVEKKCLATVDQFEDFYTSIYSSVHLVSSSESAEVADVNAESRKQEGNQEEESPKTSVNTPINFNKTRFVSKRRGFQPKSINIEPVCPSSTDSVSDTDSDDIPLSILKKRSLNRCDSSPKELHQCLTPPVTNTIDALRRLRHEQSPDLFDSSSEELLLRVATPQSDILTLSEDNGSQCNSTCDIAGGCTEVFKRPEVFGVSNRPTVFNVQPGKSWRRSLAIIKRNTLFAERDSLEGQTFTNNDCVESQFNSSVAVRRSRFTLSSLPRNVKRKARLTEYEQNRLREVAALETLIENISLNVSQHNESHTSYPEARQLVLQRCKQTAPSKFSKWYTDAMLRNCHKIGEGVYGEVFLFRSAGPDATSTVMKVIPIEGEMLVNGERQKQFDEILSEIVIASELSKLRVNFTNQTTGFNQLKTVRCLKGKYPERLIELWELFDESKGSENDNPKIFDDNQLYIVLELANAGSDLESFMFTNYTEVYQVFLQLVMSLAVAEEELQFEHRDLHWGNVLINRVAKGQVSKYKLCGETISVPTNTVEANIIDFTLSRITYDNISIFNDLSQDPDLFNAEGDYQFEIYKFMQLTNCNNWEPFQPKTNIFWLHYVLTKMTTAVNMMKKTVTGKNKKCFHTLVEWENTILQYASTKMFAQEVILPHLQQK